MKLRLSNHLFVFVLICLAPVILAVLLVGYDLAAAERQRVQDRTVSLVRSYQADIDGLVRSLGDALAVLSTSPSIEEQNWARLHAQASAVAGRLSASIFLRTLDGRHIVNTLRAAGPDLDNVSQDPVLLRADAQALASGKPVLSDLCFSTEGRRPYVALVMPIQRDGAPAYLLTIAVSASRIAEKLRLAQLQSDGWLSAVVGSDMRLLARTRDPATFVGTPAGSEITRAFRAADSGFLQSRTLDGVEVVTAYQRTDFGWYVIVSAPLSVVHAPVRALIWGMAGIAGCVLCVTAFGAWTYGRRLGREVSSLSRNARAMGSNQPLQPYTQHIVEVAEAQQALLDAQQRVDQLIAELNHRVKNTLTVIKVLAGRSVGSRRDRDAVSARISALTIAHEALTETLWRGADLGKLAQAIARSADATMTCTGPAIVLEPKATVALAQVVQELVSNARQHGALRDRSGRIELSWRIAADTLVMDWDEQAAARSEGPTHAAGFGLQVVELCVVRQLGGEIDIKPRIDGWSVSMRIPMRGDLGVIAREKESIQDPVVG